MGKIRVPQKVKYSYDEKGTIILPPGPPFDGEPVLIRFASGWCEAWWCPSERSETFEGTEYDGFMWVCMDDDFQKELDDALEWFPLPVHNKNPPKAEANEG